MNRRIEPQQQEAACQGASRHLAQRACRKDYRQIEHIEILDAHRAELGVDGASICHRAKQLPAPRAILAWTVDELW